MSYGFRILRSMVAVGVDALALAACSSSHSANPGATSVTTTSAPSTATSTAAKATTTTSTSKPKPTQALPPLSLATLPVPSAYTCRAGLDFLAPGNEAVGECLPSAYLVGGSDTACPAGSSMTMGPVECVNQTGIVAPVPPGPVGSGLRVAKLTGTLRTQVAAPHEIVAPV